jgi:hypothetical protein
MWPGAEMALRVRFWVVEGRSIGLGAQGAASARQEIGPRLGVQGVAGAKWWEISLAMWPGAEMALRVIFSVVKRRSIGLGAQGAAGARQVIGPRLGVKGGAGPKWQEINPAMWPGARIAFRVLFSMIESRTGIWDELPLGALSSSCN